MLYINMLHQKITSMEDKEIRYIRCSDVQLRSVEGEDNSRVIEGYAVVFDSRSEDLGGFVEEIAPEAITDEVIRSSDVLCLLDHDSRRGVLGRSRNGEGSLLLSVDDKGVKFRTELPNTALGDEVLEGLRRGDISQCSFAFTCDSDKWAKIDNDMYLRRITSINKLYDVSVVYHPAYPDTTVASRSLADYQLSDKIMHDSKADDTPNDEYYEALRKL